MTKSYDEVEKERSQRIEKYRNETELNIRVSWAINNAVALTAEHRFNEDKEAESMIKGWAEWMIAYYEELRETEAKKRVNKEDENEQAL